MRTSRIRRKASRKSGRRGMRLPSLRRKRSSTTSACGGFSWTRSILPAHHGVLEVLSGTVHVHGCAVRSNGGGEAQEGRSPAGVIEPPSKLGGLARRNLRFRELFQTVFGAPDARWKFLWTRPTYTYYRDEFFRDADPKKVLVFSGWRFVPKAIALLTSHEAEQRIAPRVACGKATIGRRCALPRRARSTSSMSACRRRHSLGSLSLQRSGERRPHGKGTAQSARGRL